MVRYSLSSSGPRVSLPLTSKEKDPGRGSFLIAILAEDITKAYGRTADGYGRIKFVLPGFYYFIKNQLW